MSRNVHNHREAHENPGGTWPGTDVERVSVGPCTIKQGDTRGRLVEAVVDDAEPSCAQHNVQRRLKNKTRTEHRKVLRNSSTTY